MENDFITKGVRALFEAWDVDVDCSSSIYFSTIITVVNLKITDFKWIWKSQVH